jgi:hypothetical protein
VSSHDATRHPRQVRILVCVECGCLSGLRALGWRGYRTDVEEDEEPALAFYCPACAARAFDEC